MENDDIDDGNNSDDVVEDNNGKDVVDDKVNEKNEEEKVDKKIENPKTGNNNIYLVFAICLSIMSFIFYYHNKISKL